MSKRILALKQEHLLITGLGLPLVISSLEIVAYYLFHIQPIFVGALIDLVEVLLAEGKPYYGFGGIGYTFIILYPLYGLLFTSIAGYYAFKKKTIAKKIVLLALFLSLLPVILFLILFS